MPRPPALGPRGEGWVIVQVILFGAIGLAGLAAAGQWTGPAVTASLVAGSLFIGAGGLLATAGLTGLPGGDALTAVPYPREAARLVESGPYRLVRHPIYGGIVIAAIGWGLVRASTPALARAAILLAFFYLKRRPQEAS